MAKTANINLRIDPKKKQQAETLFSNFGISVTDAINIFLSQAIIEGGFPFHITTQPRYNKETELAIEEAKQIALGNIKTKPYANLNELLKEIEQQGEE